MNLLKLDESVLKISTMNLSLVVSCYVNTGHEHTNQPGEFLQKLNLLFQWDGEFLVSSPAIKMTF